MVKSVPKFKTNPWYCVHQINGKVKPFLRPKVTDLGFNTFYHIHGCLHTLGLASAQGNSDKGKYSINILVSVADLQVVT